MPQHYTVTAFWDAEAEVWVASSEDVPGLATEADTMEALVAKLKVMVPELLELNHVGRTGADVPLRVISERIEMLAV